mgnify:CR=1 FL=1
MRKEIKEFKDGCSEVRCGVNFDPLCEICCCHIVGYASHAIDSKSSLKKTE